ncbi:porin family protein [Fulvivirga sedimenti]|uniref:PorT family protein n=1 Tax=Fulvivirga sedimenti TaxID=2879465 RepID=A0A9X1HTT9_9BACT|nr:porin family protein [Fulvivirga sedimenti]MCA6075515.1 PorT family protein [Fulvivirga sedimenti]MCA6076692.1 PorT family protein [Fulvivirga sedimenti]MCA6077820.1 PorT family protein [Fulvivirga sedimenti]
MKRIILLTIVLAPILAFSQFRIGARLGPSLANFTGSEVKEWGEANVDPTAQIKFHLGLYLDYYLLDNLSIQPGIFYSAKGPKYEGQTEIYDFQTNEIMMADITYKKKLGYIDIPVLVHFHINGSISVFAGPQFSFLLSAKVKNDATQEVLDALGLEEDEDVKDFYRGFDLALPIGVAYELANGINLQLGYDIGLIDIAKGYDYDGGDGNDKYYKVKNGVLKLSVGYVIKDNRDD